MSSEFALIDAIRARLGERGGRVLIGSGDDAAVARCDGLVVTSVDTFVEGVHFRLTTTSMRDLGHRCLAGAASDIAAMGAKPGEAYFALGLPEHLVAEEVLDFAEGAEALAADLGFQISGGDISRSHELLVAVTATGHAHKESELVRRDGAVPGDLVGVTGTLGGAAAGLLLLERKLGGLDPGTGEALMGRHLRPRPRIEAGQALAAAGVNAMIDLSDGVASDSARIAERSDVSIEIRLGDLPVEEGVTTVAAQAGLDAIELAVAGGEDYELLFTAPEDARGRVAAAADAAGAGVTWIGWVREGAGVRLLDEGGTERSFRGWDHLAGSRHRAGPGPA